MDEQMYYPNDLLKFQQLFDDGEYQQFVDEIVNDNDDLFQTAFAYYVTEMLDKEFKSHPTNYNTVEKALQRFYNKFQEVYNYLGLRFKHYLSNVMTGETTLDTLLANYKSSISTNYVSAQSTDSTSKTARNPTDILPSTDFIEDYTNEAWKRDGNANIEADTSRTGDRVDGVRALMDVFDKLPKSIYREVYNEFNELFYPFILDWESEE